eukprot:1349811-Prymnesium_polylepis.1
MVDGYDQLRVPAGTTRYHRRAGALPPALLQAGADDRMPSGPVVAREVSLRRSQSAANDDHANDDQMVSGDTP